MIARTVRVYMPLDMIPKLVAPTAIPASVVKAMHHQGNTLRSDDVGLNYSALAYLVVAAS